VRGLKEELGIDVQLVAIVGPLAPTHRRELHQGDAFHDVELVQSFMLRGFEGDVAFDDGEVCEARYVSLETLREDVARSPELYTQWLLEELESLRWFQSASTVAIS
jgi:isopentenyldiphosphate isomerase